VNQYQKGKTNLDFTEARDSEWQWHQLGHMQVCTSLQTDNHTTTPPPVKNWRILLVQSFTARMPSLTATSAFRLGEDAGVHLINVIYTVSIL